MEPTEKEDTTKHKRFQTTTPNELAGLFEEHCKKTGLSVSSALNMLIGLAVGYEPTKKFLEVKDNKEK